MFNRNKMIQRTEITEHSDNVIILFLVVIFLCCNFAVAQDSLNVRRVGQIRVSGTTARGVDVSGNYAYIAGIRAGVRVMDITNLSLPVEASYFNTPGFAYDVTISGNYAYIADDDRGIRIINITNPLLLEEVGFYD